MRDSVLLHSIIALNNDLGWLISTCRYGWFLCVQPLCSIILSLTKMTLATWTHSVTGPDSYAYTYTSANAHTFCTVNTHACVTFHERSQIYTCVWLNIHAHTHTYANTTFLNVFVGHALNNLQSFWLIPLALLPIPLSFPLPLPSVSPILRLLTLDAPVKPPWELEERDVWLIKATYADPACSSPSPWRCSVS